ncbi:hypothetical protein [uncultured Maritimibacter sp.]|uniref:hypothetical protein n=1 Tax=uncultured Maritimibacter sp. TaxID=991866 RepID=UPI002598834A|nr:hypothetical protein [uncultured Maritimibacter sp.]
MTTDDPEKFGWFAMKRGALDHDLFRPVGKWSKFEAWTWMIESAAVSPKVIDIGGKPYTVPRGALCFSQRFLSVKFKWSRKALTTFLQQLEAHGAIKIGVAQTGTGTKSKRTQITLCNYEKYQTPGAKREPKGSQKGAKEEQETNSRREEAENQPLKSEPENPPSRKADEEETIRSYAWRKGVELLCKSGMAEKEARKMIGKWASQFGPELLVGALDAAMKADAPDPIPYIQKSLGNKKRAVSQGALVQPGRYKNLIGSGGS